MASVSAHLNLDRPSHMDRLSRSVHASFRLSSQPVSLIRYSHAEFLDLDSICYIRFLKEKGNLFDLFTPSEAHPPRGKKRTDIIVLELLRVENYRNYFQSWLPF
jgi:hypothetical protein